MNPIEVRLAESRAANAEKAAKNAAAAERKQTFKNAQAAWQIRTNAARAAKNAKVAVVSAPIPFRYNFTAEQFMLLNEFLNEDGIKNISGLDKIRVALNKIEFKRDDIRNRSTEEVSNKFETADDVFDDLKKFLNTGANMDVLRKTI